MNNVNSTIDLSVLSDAALQSMAKKIVSAFADNADKQPTAFSLKDITKAIANFQSASVNARESDPTSMAIRNLAREALISVLNVISNQEMIDNEAKSLVPEQLRR